MSADHETHSALSLNHRSRDLRWNSTRFGFLLIFAGGLVMVVAFVLPDWSPSGVTPSVLHALTTPPVCNVDCPGLGWLRTERLLAGVWLLTGALCLLIGAFNLARRSLEGAGATFGALASVLVLGLVAVIAVILLLVVHDASLFLHSTTLLALAGLGIPPTGGVLALREPKLINGRRVYV